MKEHIKNNLPEGWAWAKIDQLVEINYGKGLKKERRKGGTFPVYGSNGIVGYHNAALTRGPTIILGRKGSIGAIHYSANSCWPIDTTYFVDEFNRLDSKYLEHALRSLNLAELDTSTAIPGLNRNDLYDQYLPLAPFPEQKRIVAKVEQLIARVKATKERLAKASMILKRFRQAVLSAACSGRLTSDLRQKNHSRKSGEDLLELILNKKETSGKKARTETDKHNSSEDKKPFDLPTTWAWATIGQITKNFDGERIPVKADDRKRRRGRYDYYGASGIIDSIDDYLFDGEFLLIAE
jgi:type I restriction enzyme S subunit